MKWSVWKKIGAILILSILWASASGQNYYLVVGAFATEGEAITQFTSYLPENGRDTAYSVTGDNNVLHLYVLRSTNQEEIVTKTLALQRELEKNPFTIQNPGVTTSPSPETTLTTTIPVSASAGAAGEVTASSAHAPPKPRGQYFKFTVHSPAGTTVPGLLHRVDLKEGTVVDTHDPDTYIDILPPVESGKIPVIFGKFGYKEVYKYIDYNDPGSTPGAHLDAHGAWVIPYTAERLEEGDVSVMYNVSFNPNEVMMLPASRDDMDELVQMMKWNPNYVIRIHSHCNGRGKREIRMPGVPFSWFKTQAKTSIVASAKELTRYRAELIRKYLLENGIRDERILIQPWGASDMVVDDDGPYNHLNDRVEIEILAD